MLKLLQYWLKAQTLLNDAGLLDRVLNSKQFDTKLERQDLADTLTELITELKKV